MKNLNVLVTGADGFIGSHLCEELVKQGFHVKVLVAYNSFNSIGWLNDLSKRKLKSIEIIFGDIRDADLINKISRKINIIFHLAALIAIPYSYRAPRSYIETNVLGTLNILQACMNNSIYKLISTSTSEVYGTAKYTPIDEKHILQAQSPYAASKIAADHLIESYYKTYKVPAVILRPFNTYGPRQSERAVIPTVIRQIIDPNCKKIKIGDTSPIRDFNFVKDTANAFIKLASANNVEYGNAYNAGSAIRAPINLTATAGNDQVTLAWDAPPGVKGITDYRIEYSTDGSSWTTFEHDASNAVTDVVDSLEDSTLYFFRVAAENYSGTQLYKFLSK